MAKRYLIDTNVIIDFSENKMPVEVQSFVASIIDGGVYLSVINKIELLGFSKVSKSLVELVEVSEIMTLSNEVIQETISIRKSKKIKLPDSIIAATAIVNDLCLLTRNVRDFDDVKGLAVMNPWTNG
jgi:hypothetical protein